MLRWFEGLWFALNNTPPGWLSSLVVVIANSRVLKLAGFLKAFEITLFKDSRTKPI